MRTLLREGRIAPPFASTKASLAEQRMKSTTLLAPVQRSSSNGPGILTQGGSKRGVFFRCGFPGLVVRTGSGIELENEDP